MTRTRLYSMLALGALLLGALLRLYHLTADPPNHFAGLGQALLTDPYHITIYARNKVLFGSWEIFDYDRWVAFKVSLVSGFAWLIFSLGGVSRVTANLTSVLLNLFATGMLVFGVFAGFAGFGKRDASDDVLGSRWFGAFVAAFLLSVTHVLIVYAREPFLEHGLLLIASACFVLVVVRKLSVWSALGVGALLALAPLAGKLFGLILLAPVALTVLLSSERRWRDLALIGASGVVTAGLWYLLVLGDDVSAYHAYLGEQSLGLYGFPPGLTSFTNFFIQFFSYGAELRLFQFSYFLPVLIVLGFAGLLSARIDGDSPWTLAFWRDRPALTFLTIWFISAWLSLMIFQYRPMRYALFVLFPGLGVVGCLAGQLFSAGAVWSKGRSFIKALWQKTVAASALYVGVAIVITQTWMATYGMKMTGSDIITVVGFSAMFAAPAVVVLWLIRRSIGKFAGSVYRNGFLALVLGSLILQTFWYYRMASNFTYDMVNASRDMEKALPDGAVLTGPYAPTLTIDNSHKNIIYTFGLKNDNVDLFRRFPITHLVGDYGNLDQAFRKFPKTKDNVEAAAWMFCAGGVRMLRLGDSFGYMKGLPETALERSERFLRTRAPSAPDSSVYHAEIFLTNNPESRVAKRQLFQSLLFKRDFDRAFIVGQEMVAESPNDCLAHFSLARSYFYLGKNLNREDYNIEGSKYLLRAIELNPASERYLRDNARQF